MGGIDWKKWQEDQDERGGPNARKPKPRYPEPPKGKKKVLTVQGLNKSLESAYAHGGLPEFLDTVDD